MGMMDLIKNAQAAVEAAKAAKAPAAPAVEAPGAPTPDPAVTWAERAEIIEEALEHAGLSAVDVQLDATGYAVLVGAVGSEDDQALAVSIVEQFEVTGLEVQLEIAPPEDVPAPDLKALWAATADAAKPQAATYTTRKGDSWWAIAERFYGDGTRWKKLKRANGWPKMLHPNVTVTLPPKDELETFSEA